MPMTTADTVGAAGTANAFRMPSLGADMEFGTLVQWHAAPGDHVARGAVIAEVETEKGVFSVESPVDGVVAELHVAPGTKVPVGTVLATFSNAAGVAAVAAVAAAPAVSAPAPTPEPAAPAPKAEPESALTPRLRASPVARRRAAELGIDLATLWHGGRDHAISLAEVERAADHAPPEPAPAPPSPTPPLPTAAPRPAVDAKRAMRSAVAAAVSRANRDIPHYYLTTPVSLRRALDWLRDRNAGCPVDRRILPAALLLRAVATALREFPELNGFYTDGGFQPAPAVHLGVAISLRAGGLIAPAIHDADGKTVDQLMDALRDLVRRTREGGLRGSEMTDATITVTNLGDEGVDTVLGVIYPPQVALVGFGRIAERPWADAGMLGVHPVVTATLAADHRATDGHYGGRFLAAIDRLLQAPEAL